MKRFRLGTWAVSTLLLIAALRPAALSLDHSASPTVANKLWITNESDAPARDCPIRIGRPFRRGEIPNYPQARVSGTPLPTQADVKTRWDDGSVKHAILSVMIPLLPARFTVAVGFGDQPTGNNEGYLVEEEMLSNDFDIEATMRLVDDGSRSASARAMIEEGAFTYWTRGPIATTVILADHSAARRFDVGFDEHRSFRPIFHLTFWPAIDKVQVRFIGEIANTEALQDERYSLQLFLGHNDPELVYSHSTFTHHGRTRWTRSFWHGGAPSAISIDHNIEYLVTTGLIPNYDAARAVSGEAIRSAYDSWLEKGRDLYDSGNWTRAMHTAGGRPEIGPYPTWSVRWLYTGDPRMQEKAFGNADLSAAWPIHFREGDASKSFDRYKNVDGLGRVVSISDRPTFWSDRLDWDATRSEDRVSPVGSLSDGGWEPDKAHQPDPVSLQYLLSGDFWYLEELLFWAAWGAADGDGGAKNEFWGRGPTGAEGGFGATQVRGQAWVFRTRIRAALLAPDWSPERSYFSRLIDDALAVWEGEREVVGTGFEEHPNWTWGRSVGHERWDGGYSGERGAPPLQYWELGTTYKADSWDCCMSPERVEYAHEPWQASMLLFSLGRARDLGFPAAPLASWLGKNLIGQLTDNYYDPYLVAAYRIPIVRESDHNYFGLNRQHPWADVRSGYQLVFDAQQFFEQDLGYVDHSYALMAGVAASMVIDEPGGTEAWGFIEDEVLGADGLDDNPKWVIMPGGPRPGAGAIGFRIVDPPARIRRGRSGSLTVVAVNGSDEDRIFDQVVIEDAGPLYRRTLAYSGDPITIRAGDHQQFVFEHDAPLSSIPGTYTVTVAARSHDMRVARDAFQVEVQQ